jgi:hypothetical protein
LASPSAYFAQHPGFDALDFQDVADVNKDGTVSNADVQYLIKYLKTGNGSLGTVPEPSTLVLGGLSALALASVGLKRRQK